MYVDSKIQDVTKNRFSSLAMKVVLTIVAHSFQCRTEEAITILLAKFTTLSSVSKCFKQNRDKLTVPAHSMPNKGDSGVQVSFGIHFQRRLA